MKGYRLYEWIVSQRCTCEVSSQHRECTSPKKSCCKLKLNPRLIQGFMELMGILGFITDNASLDSKVHAYAGRERKKNISLLLRGIVSQEKMFGNGIQPLASSQTYFLLPSSSFLSNQNPQFCHFAPMAAGHPNGLYVPKNSMHQISDFFLLSIKISVSSGIVTSVKWRGS